MAEAVAAASLAAAIVQLVDFSAKIVKRLDEFASATVSVPKSFLDIKVQLPLITSTLHSMRVLVESVRIGDATTSTLKAIIDRCVDEAQTLTTILEEALPKGALSTFQIRLRALQSLTCDKKARESVDRLLKHLQILNLYHSINSGNAIELITQELLHPSSNSSASASRFSFGLNLGNAPQIESGAFIGRDEELKQLQKWLSPQRAPLTQKIVAITRMGGLGKTQLSIAFAKQYGHGYSSVFWLNAKDEATLR
jgi:N-terminal domain on NACHT_NTPase and P-loop NTPases